MKKFLLTFLLLILFCNAVYAEKMPVSPYPKGFNIKDNPIAYPYFEEYAKRLYKKFDTNKLWMLPMGYGVDITWFIHKDGTISNITPEWNDDKIPISYKYGMSLVKATPHLPFPKDLEDENIRIEAFFCKDNFDRINMDYYPKIKRYRTPSHLSISIFKNHKIKKHTTPTPELPFKN